MKRKKLGLLGGSFDPLHFGHFNMALSLLEAHALDTVLFCPTHVSPFKTARPPVAHSEHRLQMILLGIQKIEQFSLLDWEITKNGPSYSIDTIKRLRSESDAELFLLLGEDQLADLHRWKDVDELLTLAPPLIASRENKSRTLDHLSPSLHRLIDKGRTVVPMMDISSTTIRQRLSNKQYCGHLVPHLILDYIKNHHLYM
jgi:nicotinate-nucleotide adenylyltransferase